MFSVSDLCLWCCDLFWKTFYLDISNCITSGHYLCSISETKLWWNHKEQRNI